MPVKIMAKGSSVASIVKYVIDIQATLANKSISLNGQLTARYHGTANQVLTSYAVWTFLHLRSDSTATQVF